MAELPYAPEAEIAVLGGMIMDGGAADIVFELLEPADFYDRRHPPIARAIAELHRRGETIDPVMVSEQLKQAGDLERAGGIAYIAELLDAVPTAANIAYHARVVADRAIRRRLYDAAQQIAGEVISGDVADSGDLIDRAERRILEVAQRQGVEGPLPVQEVLWDAVRLIESGGVKGIPTGLRGLDAMLGGWKPGNLYVIAGATSMGKTAITIQCAAHAAIDEKVPTAIFSIEMTRVENVLRMFAVEGALDLDAMIQGQLPSSDLPQLHLAAERVYSAPLVLDDTATRVSEIRARARRLKRERGLGLLVVDHIHDMNGEGENRREQVGGIGRGLKQLAKELDIPVIAVSQLSRAPSTRPDRRPQLSDLRESGDLEAVANVVILMYRPEYYFGPQKDGKDIRGAAEAIVAKNRNGPTGRVELYYRAHCTRFEDLSPRNDR